ncbi:hypothetical protein ACVWWN_000358 [Mycobacterium sp. URHB0021]
MALATSQRYVHGAGTDIRSATELNYLYYLLTESNNGRHS